MEIKFGDRRGVCAFHHPQIPKFEDARIRTRSQELFCVIATVGVED